MSMVTEGCDSSRSMKRTISPASGCATMNATIVSITMTRRSRAASGPVPAGWRASALPATAPICSTT